jgi:cGMP-dependent protein kinase 1
MSMIYCTNANHKFIFKQGDKQSTSFFFLDSGECTVIVDGKVKKKLASGEFFGEKALLYNAPRSATIAAEPHCKFWALDRKTFRNMISEITQRSFKENREFIDHVSFFGRPFKTKGFDD